MRALVTKGAVGGRPYEPLGVGAVACILSSRHRDRGPGAGTVSGKTDQDARTLCAGRADRRGGAALLRAIATKSRPGRVRREQARRLRNRRDRGNGAGPARRLHHHDRQHLDQRIDAGPAREKNEDRLRAGRADRHPARRRPVLLATTTPFSSDHFSPKTFAEFLAYAKAHPGKVRYGSAGIGSYQQINTEILARRAGLELVHIPFKGGGAEIIRDLANGDIHVSWFNITNPIGMMKAGRVRALAIAAEERLAQHPDVPTLAEVGYPGMRASQWVAAFAPSGVPPDIIETLRKAFLKAMTVPDMQEAFARGGMLVPRQASLEDRRGWLREEMASWKRDVDDRHIVVEE